MNFKKILNHLPFILFSYFFLGVIIGGFFATQDRVELLNSTLLTSGSNISIIAFIIYLPILFYYLIKVKK